MKSALLGALACAVAIVGCALDRSPLSGRDHPSDAAIDAARVVVDARIDPRLDAGMSSDGGLDALVEPDAPTAVDAGPGLLCGAGDTTLVACYPLDRDTRDHGPRANDLGATNIAHSSSGGVTLTTDAALVCPARPELSHTLMSVEAWARLDVPPAPGARAVIVDHDGVFALFVRDGALWCTVGTTEGALAAVAAPGPPAEEIHHVACVCDGTTTSVLVDGVVVAITFGTGTAMLLTPATPLHIGENGPTGDDQWIGMLDDVRLWDRALGADEIRAHVSTGRIVE